MNTNFLQTLMTVAIAISGMLTTLLISMGCTHNAVSGALDCANSTAPLWLAPYLVIVASVLSVVKLILGAFEGKLTKPTVPVVPDGQGKPGVVTVSQVKTP